MYRSHILPVGQKTLANLVLALGVTSFAAMADAPIRYGHSDAQAYKTNVSKKSNSPKVYALNSTSNEDLFFYPDEVVRAPRQTSAKTATDPLIKATNAGYTPNQTCTVDPVEYRSYMKIGNPYEVSGVKYTPAEDPFYNKTGTASWYGPQFHGKKTANGEIFDMMELTAAHPTLPLPSYVLVENLQNGRKLVVRVNDRGPFKKNRLIDLSKAAATKLDVIKHGTAQVRVQYLGPAEKAGTDCAPVQKAPIMEAKVETTEKRWSEAVSESHFVQIGSFASRDNAKSLLSQAKAVYNKGDVVFANVNGNGRYRVMLGPFTSRDNANSTLSLMKTNGFDGLIVKNPS